MNPAESLQDQCDFLFSEYKNKTVSLHVFIKLINMAYQDYLDFYPNERPQKDIVITKGTKRE